MEEPLAEIFEVKTEHATQAIDITDPVAGIVRAAGVRRGLCHVMVLHSTAAVVVNETHDPNIGTDIATALERVAPEGHGWLHDRIDDNAHSHIRAALLGPSETIPIEDGKLLLGTWQAVMLLEFDGPRTSRRVAVQILPIG